MERSKGNAGSFFNDFVGEEPRVQPGDDIAWDPEVPTTERNGEAQDGRYDRVLPAPHLPVEVGSVAETVVRAAEDDAV